MDKIYASLRSREGEIIEIRPAGEENIDELLRLEARSINPETFAEITRGEMLESMREDVVLAAFAEGKIVALNIILKNRVSDRSLAPDIGEDYRSVATFDGVIVAPEYRGLGLQRIFLNLAADLGRSFGASRLAATVAPANAPSRANFKKCGFSELGEFPKYGSTRIIVAKDL